MYFAQLFRRYQSLLLEFGDCEIDFDFIKDYRPEMLQKKIEKIFGDPVTIEASTGPRHQKIIYKTDIDISIMANNTKFLESKEEHKFEDVAYDLRSCIKNIDSHPLPRRLTVDDIIREECEIPQELFNFIRNLVYGPNLSEENADLTTTKITSICSDIIYAVTKGRCKPSKNVTLGLAMKSLTNSRRVITMLNRYGHSIGYNLAEELESEMTYTSIQNSAVIPAGIIATNTLSTHVAFDNFDRFVDTTSGKDTIVMSKGVFRAVA
ncbi:GSCOCG00012125001-RA-CDS [Cotesia congregata]|nr:GSCOCG00012125001-RA-CDS [Cotesia congregata]